MAACLNKSRYLRPSDVSKLELPCSNEVSAGQGQTGRISVRLRWHLACSGWLDMATSHSRRRKDSKGRPAAKPESVCLLRWTFSKGARSITCQLENDPQAASYDVCVVPHWDVSSAIVEGAQEPIGAFRRHADIARRLRAAGWSLDRRAHGVQGG